MKSLRDKSALWETKVLVVFENNREMNPLGHDSETKEISTPVLSSAKSTGQRKRSGNFPGYTHEPQDGVHARPIKTEALGRDGLRFSCERG
jgi:hypothetical protein